VRRSAGLVGQAGACHRCGNKLQRVLLQLSATQIPPATSSPPKDKSTERVDGIVALIMATGRALVAQEERHVEYSLFFV
jgi:phage terminase large subunit-like protein